MQTRQNYKIVTLALLAMLGLGSGCQRNGHLQTASSTGAEFWLTNPDRSALFVKQPGTLAFTTSSNQNPIIDIDETKTFQSIDGFGYTLTGGSAMLIHRMDAKARAALC